MDSLLTMRGAKLIAASIATCFLVVHLLLAFLFWRWGVVPMACFNAVSIVFYLLTYLLINKGKLALFMTLTYAEVVVHMVTAAILTGWEGGFQVTILGMSTLVFLFEYLCRSLELPYVRGLPLCLCGMGAYLACCVVCVLNPAPYALDERVSFGLRLAWAAITFVVSIMVLLVFTMRASRTEEVLETRLSHDKLTGLPNRYFVAEYLSKLATAKELPRYWVAVADIDDFKAVNDSYGHNAGDMVLETVAQLLCEGAGAGVQVCRWGGEEFLLVGKIGEGMPAVVERLERIRALVAGHTMWYEEHRISVTLTVGVAAYREGATTTEWINEADEKLYLGKTSGKNKVVA